MKHSMNMKRRTRSLQLINVYSSNNIGDAAIYASMVQLAGGHKTFWPNYQTNIATNNARLGYLVDKYLPENKIDVNISVGGDIFNNARPSFFTRQFLNNLLQLSKEPSKSLVFGQSIPRSCRGIAFHLLAHSFSKLSSVYVRDRESYERLNKVGVNALLGYDVVFSQRPEPAWLDSTVEALSKVVDFSEVALISLRPFDAMYQYNSDACVTKLIQLCKLIAQHGYMPTVMVHARVNGRDADMVLVDAIKAYCQIKVIDPFLVSENIADTQNVSVVPWQVGMAITALSALVIGIRYHSSVFRLASGKMPYNIFYSNKGEDLCKRLGVPGVSIQDFHPENHIADILATANKLFDNTQIARQVKEDFSKLIDRAIGNRSSLNSAPKTIYQART